MTSLLEATGLGAAYGKGADVISGLNLRVDAGEIVGLLGTNGAGKTTTLRALSGMIRSSGSVQFKGVEISTLPTHKRARLGIAHVPQGRGTMPFLTVEENLRAGASRLSGASTRERMDHWCDVFPRLGDRRVQLAGTLSGGEQQMLAVARAMMSEPELVLLDEPSLGLAPQIVTELFQRFAGINSDTGTSMLIVEQNASVALNLASRAYVLEAGEITRVGSADELRSDDSIRKAYLGV